MTQMPGWSAMPQFDPHGHTTGAEQTDPKLVQSASRQQPAG
jgi:hypothetical protein